MALLDKTIFFFSFCRCFNTLRTGKNRDLAIMSKLLGGFLDDGPQFVIRVVVVVLFGIGSESKCKYLSI